MEEEIDRAFREESQIRVSNTYTRITTPGKAQIVFSIKGSHEEVQADGRGVNVSKEGRKGTEGEEEEGKGTQEEW